MKLPFLVFSEQKKNEMVHYFAKFAEVRDIKEASEVSKLTGWIIKNVEIFKVGTWKKRTYTADHLQEMGDNFRSLKDAGTYDPVFKKNHSERVEDQVGWIYDVRKDGDVLLADIHITDWSAYDKIQEGTWKNLSSEIYLPALALDEFGINGHVLRGVAIVYGSVLHLVVTNESPVRAWTDLRGKRIGVWVQSAEVSPVVGYGDLVAGARGLQPTRHRRSNPVSWP